MIFDVDAMRVAEALDLTFGEVMELITWWGYDDHTFKFYTHENSVKVSCTKNGEEVPITEELLKFVKLYSKPTFKGVRIERGELIMYEGYFNRDEAIGLARWILEMFDEATN